MSETIEVKFNLDKNRLNQLENMFPGKENYQQVANEIASFMTNELIDLFAGQKRYLSLSHQYIEWVQRIYETLLPEEEYTYETIFDQFNFPPGTAAYMARVLRSRQNTTIHLRAKEHLLSILQDEINSYERLSQEDKRGEKNRRFRLTIREFDILMLKIGNLSKNGVLVEPPTIVYRGREFIDLSFGIDNIHKVIEN